MLLMLSGSLPASAEDEERVRAVSPGQKPGRATVTRVHDREELKNALGRAGTEVIELTETIPVRETLVVRGKKTLTGPGGLCRAIAGGTAFGGSLLAVRGDSLRLRGVTMDGRGESPVLAGRLYGWLIEVEQGQLIIESGTDLKENKNSVRKSDGGGAVRVRSGGVCTMDGGSIRNNTCVTGGAGVRVDAGGVFYMKAGSISGNRVSGVAAVEGFDGRGGGILNRGTAGLYGGSVTSNTVTGVSSQGRSYGGVGGGLANAGDCVLKGCTIRSNHAERGADVGALDGRLTGDGTVSAGEIWLRPGQCFHVGSGFRTESPIRLVPEEIKAGVTLVSGLTGDDWKKSFAVGADLKKEGLLPCLRDGSLMIKNAPASTPTPAPTKSPVPTPMIPPATGAPSGVSYAMPSPSVGGLPPIWTERPRPSYLPVATTDPEAEIILATIRPEKSDLPVETAVSAGREPLPTPASDQMFRAADQTWHRRTLPWYYLFRMEGGKQAKTVRRLPAYRPAVLSSAHPSAEEVSTAAVEVSKAAAEVAKPAEVVSTAAAEVAEAEVVTEASARGQKEAAWHFSREEIREWKRRFREQGIRYDEEACRDFMEGIRSNGGIE